MKSRPIVMRLGIVTLLRFARLSPAARCVLNATVGMAFLLENCQAGPIGNLNCGPFSGSWRQIAGRDGPEA